MNNKFEVKFTDLHWIDHTDNPDDLCLHGKAFVQIGEEILSTENDGDWTLSSAAYYFLKSFKNNYQPDQFGNALIPCCGHFMFIHEDTDELIITGCPNGIDWHIQYTENEVTHRSNKGNQATVSIDDWKNIVLRLANEIEDFYQQSTPKKLPDDVFEKEAYLRFWEDWHRMKNSI